MSTTLPISNAPIPEDADDVDVALDVAGLGTGLDSYVVGRFANTGLRDAGRPVPATGMLDAVAGTPVVRRVNAWRPVDLAGTWFAEANGSPRTLSSLASDIGVTGTDITITIPEQRRIRIACHGSVLQNTATQGLYKFWPAYIAGSSAAGAAAQGSGNTVSGMGNGLYTPFFAFVTVPLAAGTWSFCIIAQRLSGGSVTDTVASSHIEVSDAGPS